MARASNTETEVGGRDDAASVADDLALMELAAHLRGSVARLARLLRQLDEEGLSATQAAALAMVERHGPITLGDLATIERLSKPTVTNVVGKLEDRGYLRRLNDPVDGRVCRVELTEDGREYLIASRSRRTAWLVEQLQLRSSDEIAKLQSAIGVLDSLSGLTRGSPGSAAGSSGPTAEVRR